MIIDCILDWCILNLKYIDDCVLLHYIESIYNILMMIVFWYLLILRDTLLFYWYFIYSVGNLRWYVLFWPTFIDDDDLCIDCLWQYSSLTDLMCDTFPSDGQVFNSFCYWWPYSVEKWWNWLTFPLLMIFWREMNLMTKWCDDDITLAIIINVSIINYYYCIVYYVYYWWLLCVSVNDYTLISVWGVLCEAVWLL